MKKIFLEAKHWQLFGFTVGIPLLYQIFLISSIALVGDQMEEMFIRFIVFMPLFGIILYGWIWSVGVGLQKKYHKIYV